MKNQNDWTDEVLNGLTGLRRVPLPAGLRERIERRIYGAEAARIAPRHLTWLAAAAGLLLLVNLAVLLPDYSENTPVNSTGVADETALFTDFNLYD